MSCTFINCSVEHNGKYNQYQFVFGQYIAPVLESKWFCTICIEQCNSFQCVSCTCLNCSVEHNGKDNQYQFVFGQYIETVLDSKQFFIICTERCNSYHCMLRNTTASITNINLCLVNISQQFLIANSSVQSVSNNVTDINACLARVLPVL